MEISAEKKCAALLEKADLPAGRKNFVESLAKQIAINSELYPTVHQAEILDGMYREFERKNRSQVERDVHEFLGLK